MIQHLRRRERALIAAFIRDRGLSLGVQSMQAAQQEGGLGRSLELQGASREIARLLKDIENGKHIEAEERRVHMEPPTLAELEASS